MARGVVIPAEGGVAKIADPGVVYMTRVGSLKMTDWGRLQCRFTIFAIVGISSDNHADDACNAALECLNALGVSNMRPDKKGLDIGIGINSGKVILGNIGSKYRLKFTAIGDNVNLAARMESSSLQYKCNIILTENTRKLLTKGFNIKELDRVTVKGIEGQLIVYSLHA